jgi:hypothetical protein
MLLQVCNSVLGGIRCRLEQALLLSRCRRIQLRMAQTPFHRRSMNQSDRGCSQLHSLDQHWTQSCLQGIYKVKPQQQGSSFAVDRLRVKWYCPDKTHQQSRADMRTGQRLAEKLLEGKQCAQPRRQDRMPLQDTDIHR